MTTKFTNPLDSVEIASPCSMDWDAMEGNERQRHCGDCELDVYNLSEMTKQEAINLVMHREGRLCTRFFRREDGTILTKDCPVGWAAVKKRMSRVWGAVASVLITAVSGFGMVTYVSQSDKEFGVVEEVPLEKKSLPMFNIEPRITKKEICDVPGFTLKETEEPTNDPSKTITESTKTPKIISKEKQRLREVVGMVGPDPNVTRPDPPVKKGIQPEPKFTPPLPKPSPRPNSSPVRPMRPEMGDIALPSIGKQEKKSIR